MKIIDAVQGSDEWLLARVGRATASRFSDVLAKGAGVSRKNYKAQLIAERLTGVPVKSWNGNADTERGTVQEPYARMAYEASPTGGVVREVGFCQHDTLMVGASPDGLVDDDGGVEIKSVIATVQMATIERGAHPTSHAAQIQGCLWITGRKWWDFVSYSADMPENLRLFVYRVMPDPEYIIRLESEITVFLREVDMEVNEWKIRILKHIQGGV